MIFWLKKNALLLLFFTLAGLIGNPVFLSQPVFALGIPTSISITVCGDHIKQGNEFCDEGSDNNKVYVYGANPKYCNVDCASFAPACGDTVIQSGFGEICDSASGSCMVGLYSGTKACNDTCDAWLDCQATEYCGDGINNGGETCDGGTQNCTINGYNGKKACLGDCTGWGDCVASDSCGDKIINGGEICDGGTQNCTINGYNGNKTCNSSCSGWNLCQTSEYCGDGIKNGNEQCDGGSSCTSLCQIKSGGGGGGGGGGSSSSVATKVIMEGKAYLKSSITILKDGKVTTVTNADENADFRVEISDVTPGVTTFGVWAKDNEGRKSITFSFTVNVQAGTTITISDIFLPPTIELDKTAVQKGEMITIEGTTAPLSRVDIVVQSAPPGITKTVATEKNGIYSYNFDTSVLEEGSHLAKAKATSPGGLMGSYSQSMTFTVGNTGFNCPKNSDINRDKRVNLVDLSILLYNWGVPKNANADINCDKKVNLIDFSIMMYYWTG